MWSVRRLAAVATLVLLIKEKDMQPKQEMFVRRSFVSILILGLVLTLLGCSKSPVGRYKQKDGDLVIELKPDGTFQASAGIPHLQGAKNGTYEVDGEHLKLFWQMNGGKQMRFGTFFGDNVFTLFPDGSPVPEMAFVKQAEGSSVSKAASNEPKSDVGKLTTAKAQEAVDKALVQIRSEYNHGANKILDGGTASVQGIQELPQENAAQADVTYNSITSQCGDGSIREPWKNGVAVFKHYNDGRWVLTKLTTNAAIACWATFTVNIEVK
jgi:hypothetical protein